MTPKHICWGKACALFHDSASIASAESEVQRLVGVQHPGINFNRKGEVCETLIIGAHLLVPSFVYIKISIQAVTSLLLLLLYIFILNLSSSSLEVKWKVIWCNYKGRCIVVWVILTRYLL